MQAHSLWTDKAVSWLKNRDTEYRMGLPTVSDRVYDMVADQVRLKVGDHYDTVNDDCGVKKTAHGFGSSCQLTIHMGSQNKAENMDGLTSYFHRVDDQYLSASLKMDGMSMELTYAFGSLLRGLSRGDGRVGTDYTLNIMAAKNLPLTIGVKFPIVVIRVECVILKSDLIALNQELVADGLSPFPNTRNGAVAVVRSDKNRKYAKYLSIYAFDMEIVE